MAEVTTPPDGVYPDISERDYHADRGSISSTGAKLLLRSPAKFRWERDQPRKPKKEYDFGHVAHELLLEKGSGIFILDPEVHGLNKDGSVSKAPANTSMWKDAAEAARARGEVPVSREVYEAAVLMVEAVRRDPVAGPLFKEGEAEVSAYATDPVTGVRVRCRFDWKVGSPSDFITVVDLKTTRDAEPDEFAILAAKFGYHLAAAWYSWIASVVFGVPLSRVRFVLVAVEKEPPHLVSVTEWGSEDLDFGMALRREAIDLYQECTSTNTWPSWRGHDANKVHTIHVPAWMTPRGPTVGDLTQDAYLYDTDPLDELDEEDFIA